MRLVRVVVVVTIGFGAVLVRVAHRPSPDAVPEPLLREFKVRSYEAVGTILPDARGLTREQLDAMLYASAGHGSTAMVAWLLAKGANPRANQNGSGGATAGRSALQEAARFNRCDSERSLIRRVEDVARAFTIGSTEQRSALVAEQVALFVNESDAHRISPLHEAVEGGERECVATLHEAGARVDVIDERGVTPLKSARQKQFNHLLPMLTTALVKQGGVDQPSTQ